MNRRFPAAPEKALDRLWAMMRSRHGLELLRAQMPPGATLEQARRLRGRIKQEGRQPCSFLDRELGVLRD
jgi:hypothetical protein